MLAGLDVSELGIRKTHAGTQDDLVSTNLGYGELTEIPAPFACRLIFERVENRVGFNWFPWFEA